MKQHMIFFDIDGTLMDDKTDIVPESAINALHLARENGHLIFICTGRCETIWPEELLKVGFDGVVGGCGTHVVYQGKELLHVEIEKELAREIADDLTKFHIDGVLEGKEHAYFRHDYWMPFLKTIFEENGTFSPKYQLFWEEEETLHFDKMALFFDESSDMDSFKKKYEDRFDFIRRDSTFYEVVPKGYSKASGIALLCETLGIPKENTIGVGDSTNDLPMLEYTEVSIAMGSGNPAIFSVVDFVTDAVLEDGIEKALRKYSII